MKLKALCFIFFAMTLTLDVKAQSEWNLIDIEYDNFMGFLRYSVKGQRLSFSDLEPILKKYPESNTFLEKAKNRKKIATPTLIIGSAGLLASLFTSNGRIFENHLFWISGVVLGVGSGFQQGYLVNLNRSVNAFNKNLLRDNQAELKLKLSPTGTGLALVF